MGKTSRSSRRSVSRSSSRKSLQTPMTGLKKTKSIRRMRKKNRHSIKKLFNRLKDDSKLSDDNSSVTSFENTVIIIEDDDDRINKNNDAGDKSNKRKITDDDESPSTKIRRTETVIQIPDDTPKKSVQVHCSTPLPNKERKDMNISNLSNEIGTDIINLTKQINGESYVTIDLTNDSLDRSKNTMNDKNISTNENTFHSLSNVSSMSGDSEVTVIKNNKLNRKKKVNMKNLSDQIAQLNSSEKGKLLNLITKKIFNGCNLPSLSILEESTSSNTQINKSGETAEDTYIKEVILGKTTSRNSIGSNIYNPDKEIKNKSGLRMVVIDGSNVAMEHGQHKIFSVKGLKICIDYFVRRGHIVKAFVPRFRCKFGKSSDPKLLDDLERKGLVVYTPSREVQGKMITSYDDRYIVQCAAEFDGIIVSGDNYRDLLQENPRWRFVIENRLLPFTWVNDMLMFPKDPLGRNGPTLEAFLRHPIKV